MAEDTQAPEPGSEAGATAGAGYFDTLVVAEFADAGAAERAYSALRDAEHGGRLRVDGVLAVRSDAEGRIDVLEMTDHATKTGLKWGAVGGVVLGVLFPPAVLASTIAWGAVGGVIGKLRSVHHKAEVADQLDGAIGPDRSGLIAVVHRAAVPIAEQSMPEATRITVADVDEATAREITEAAQRAG